MTIKDKILNKLLNKKVKIIFKNGKEGDEEEGKLINYDNKFIQIEPKKLSTNENHKTNPRIKSVIIQLKNIYKILEIERNINGNESA